MGMYDNVKIAPSLLPVDKSDMELLTPSAINGSFQTKDWDQILTMVEIREDKSLWSRHFDLEEVPSEERPYPDETDGLLSLFGGLRETNVEIRHETSFSGDIEFYDGEWSNEEQKHLWWYSFRAHFENGYMTDIQIVEKEIYDDGAR